MSILVTVKNANYHLLGLMNTLAKWTVDDYHGMIAAGILQDRQLELLAGEIHEMAPEKPPHILVEL